MLRGKFVIKIINARFKQFCKHSTLHGMYYFFSSSTWCIHLIWGIVMSCSISLCIYLSHMIWSKFVDNPTFTVVESTHYQIEHIPFPAVSVCDLETVYVPNTINITQILNLRGYTSDNIKEFYASFSRIKDKDYIPDDYVKKMHYVLEDLGYTYDILVNLLKKPCDVLIKECIWRSKVTDCSRMFRSVYTIMGYCCQFDIEYFSKNAEKYTNLRTGVEMSEALDIMVNIQKILLNGSSVDSFVFLYVFDKQDSLTLLNSPISLTPLTYFDVTVEIWSIDSSTEVKTLSLNNRKCFLPADTKKNANSYQGCMTVLMMRKVIEHCRCIPFHYNNTELDVEDFPNCTWEKLKCVYQILERVQRDIRDILVEHECYQRCDYVHYETEVEYVKVDRLVERANGKSRVSVHFADSTCIKYRREVLYTWDQMLANLGGIFGLCLGGSIISIIELLWFLFGLLFSFCRFQTKVTNKRDDKRVFTLSKNKSAISPRAVKKGRIPKYPYLN